MPVVNGSGLFGHLRKADEVACALLADFIESDDFNKEQSDDLERRKQEIFSNDVFLYIEQTTTMVIEHVSPHFNDTEEEVIRAWVQRVLQHINLATLVRFLHSTEITQALDFSFRHIISDDSDHFPPVLSALVDLRTRILSDFINSRPGGDPSYSDDDSVDMDDLVDKALPQQAEKYGMESQEDAETLLDLINRRRLEIGDMTDNEGLENLVPNDRMVAAWKKALLFMHSRYGTSTPPSILFPESNSEGSRMPSNGEDQHSDSEDAYQTPPDDGNNDLATQAEEMLQSMMKERASTEAMDDVDSYADSQLDDYSEDMYQFADYEEDELDESSSTCSQQDIGPITDTTANEPTSPLDVNLSNDQQSQPTSVNVDDDNDNDNKNNGDNSDGNDDDEVVITKTSQSFNSNSILMDSFSTIHPSQSSSPEQHSTQSSSLANPATVHTSDGDDDHAQTLLDQNRVGKTLKRLFRSSQARQQRSSSARIRRPLDRETSESRALSWSDDEEPHRDNAGQSQNRDSRESKRQRQLPSSLSAPVPRPADTAATAIAQTQRQFTPTSTGLVPVSQRLERRAPFSAQGDPTTGRRRHDQGPPKTHTFWTSDELAALKEGLGRHKGRRWTTILKEYNDRFHVTRTSVDLRDKARNEIKERSRRNEPLEEFSYAQ